MSERTPATTTTAPESTAGLAMILGELKSDLHHFIDETRGTVTDLQAQLTAERATRESLTGGIATLKDIVSQQQNVLTKLAEWMESLTAKPTSSKGTGDTTQRDAATVPERRPGETNRDFHARIVTWAQARQTPVPPKPTSFEAAHSYTRRIATWATENVAQ